jgi:hypothetical protein
MQKSDQKGSNSSSDTNTIKATFKMQILPLRGASSNAALALSAQAVSVSIALSYS